MHRLQTLARAGALLALLGLSLGARAAVVLQYHHISEETPSATSISPALFRQHMAHLQEADYSVVPLQELVEALKQGEVLPDKAVAITFDDGYASIYDTAFPVLKEYGWPFTLFINVEPLQQQKRQFITWDQVREMAEAGATIANHSYSHAHFPRRRARESEAQWRERLKTEIEQTEAIIRKETGQRHRLFAYPYGEYDLEVQKLIAELDFVAFAQHSGPVGLDSDLRALPRFPFGGIYGDMDDFKTKVASRPMPLAKVELRGGGDKLRDTLLPQWVDRPELHLTLSEKGLANRIQCFASGQGAIPIQVDGDQLTARAGKALPVGRSRYNCTAMSDQRGRFYWYSHFFMRKKPDGGWYEE